MLGVFPLLIYHWMGASVYVTNRKPFSWTDFLPAIAHVESSNRQWARSYLGAEHGRGLYGISEIAFEHWRWYHADHWVVKQGLGPDCLYNTNVGREVAIWYLSWLDKYYSNRSDKIRLVLSAYNQGPRHTDEKGLAHEYIEKVFDGMRVNGL